MSDKDPTEQVHWFFSTYNFTTTFQLIKLIESYKILLSDSAWNKIGTKTTKVNETIKTEDVK